MTIRRRAYFVGLLLLCIAVIIGGAAYMLVAEDEPLPQGADNPYGLTYEIDSGNYGYGVYVTGVNSRDVEIPQMIAGEAVLSVALHGVAIDSIDVSKAISLKHLDVSDGRKAGGNLKKLDLTSCTELKSVNCRGNKLMELDLGVCGVLTSLHCQDNFLENPQELSEAAKGTLSLVEVVPQMSRIDVSEIEVKFEEAVYTGQPVEPSVTATFGDIELQEGVDFKIKYSDNESVGEGKAVIKGKGICFGKVEVSYTVSPVPVALEKVEQGVTGIRVEWATPFQRLRKQISGYIVRYSTDPGFEKEKTEVIVVQGRTSDHAVISLDEEKEGVALFVQVCSFKNRKGVEYRSTWSEPDTIHITAD